MLGKRWAANATPSIRELYDGNEQCLSIDGLLKGLYGLIGGRLSLGPCAS